MADVSTFGFLSYLICLLCLCGALPPLSGPREFSVRSQHEPDDNTGNNRQKRFLPIQRSRCDKLGSQISEAQNASMRRVDLLREQMDLRDLAAYIVSNQDSHQDEEKREFDKRANYLSGFNGGDAFLIVTKKYSVFFVYQAEEVDKLVHCNWQFRRAGSMSVGAFLKQLGAGNKVGFDPLTMSYHDVQEYSQAILEGDLIPIPLDENLVDIVRNESGETEPKTRLIIHDLKYTGRTWQSKILRVRNHMTLTSDVQAVVLDSLDDIAWLFNLRGFDYEYVPTFLSFAIVEYSQIRLYLRDRDYKLTEEIAQHLNVTKDGVCKYPRTQYCLTVLEYGTFLADLKTLSAEPVVQFVWIDPRATMNAGIMLAIGEQKVHEEMSPVTYMKCVKNEVEEAGMMKAYLRDAVAFVDFMSRIEREVQSGIKWSEMTASEELTKYRKRLPLNMGESFETISAVGDHAATIHYRVTKKSDRALSTEEVYLVDSGGQYLDGTIDVTRTFHFGTPREVEIDTYTRILMGLIDVASTIFIPRTYGRELAFVSRRHLWEGGYDFWHMVGHGVGHFLHIHEGPVDLNIGEVDFDETKPFEEGVFQTIEPGYYSKGEFGIRLEHVVVVAKALNQSAVAKAYTPGTQTFYRFQSVSYVPFEPKMINFRMLSPQQISWLNNYNKQCRLQVGTILWNQGKKLAYDWLMSKTEPVENFERKTSAAVDTKPTYGAVVISCLFLLQLIFCTL